MPRARRSTTPHHPPVPDRRVVAAVAALLVAVCALAPLGQGPRQAVLAALPGSLVAVAAALAVSGRRQPCSWLQAWQAGLAGAGASVAVGVAWTSSLVPAEGATAGAGLAALPARAGAALLVLTAAARLGWRLQARTWTAGGRRALVGSVAVALLGGLLAPLQSAQAEVEPATPAACASGQQQRSYAVAATTVDIPFNRWGATLRSGRVFVLEQDLAATKHWAKPLVLPNASADPAKNRRLRPRPLVLRANEGECVKVTLTNRLSAAAAHDLPSSPRVGIQASGVVTDARTSGGARVGFNADPTVAIGESITYYWRVPAQEGLFLFQDMATPAGGQADGGSRSVGLYGALAVEPAGSVWTDPRSGAVLSGTPGQPDSAYRAVSAQSGELYVEADIHPPGKPSFRESVQLAQDEISGIGMGFNYGSEPQSKREAAACPDCIGEETWLSSWPYGDPALVKLASGPGPWLPKEGADRRESEDCGLPESCFVSNVFHTYNGDATKLRFGLAGVKETHVFHLHAHQWLADDRDDRLTGEGPGAKPESSTLDSQSFGPGEGYTADLLNGAGSRNGTFGDSVFHCHLYPHFVEGFWALLRVHDVRLDGRTATPDAVNVRPLVPLPGQPAPPLPTAANPGYPSMIPGTYGWRAPQPPDSITEGGADGTPVRPAPRLVAGRSIDAGKLAVEDAVMRARNGGQRGPAGAPFADPCPGGAREVDYDVTILQRDLIYNEAGHHDPQARFMALTKDVPEILAGRKKVEPLFIRVNAGDCVNFSLTNMAPNWTGGDAFQQVTQTNMAGGHVHLVKFDVTASDGGSNGWNYQQAAFTKDQAELTRKQAAGEVTCTPGTPFYGGPSSGCRIDEPGAWTAPQDSSGMWGQTIHERWFADYELRTVFTHDHHFAAVVQNHGQFGALIVEPQGFDVRDPATGAYLQPINSAANGPRCAVRCTGEAVGESVDVTGPGANDDFREYGIAIADFVPLVKRGGDPRNPRDVVNPPGAPEHYPDADPGTFAINYRNAPLVERRQRDGQPVDPAHRFSSYVFGDPMTPLLQGYARDNIKLRVIQGSHEEQHVFQVHGLRWREEPDDPGSPLVNAQTIGISEAFNAEMPGFDCTGTDVPCRGDYLYGGTNIDDLWSGMWGIMRVHGAATPGLRALPDNAPRAAGAAAAPAPRSRLAPPRANGPGESCPAGAPVRDYDVVAVNRDLVYNQHGDHDPKGLMYVLAEDEAAVMSGAKKPEPLVIRANAGDCVSVDLRNALPASYGNHTNGVDGDPPLMLEPFLGTRMGTRVGLHPQLLRYDVRLSDGGAVGFNPDSTAGIGQTVSYRWYADTELGATNLLDYGDVRGHRQHGLAGALVIEPRDATYHDPVTGAPVRSGVAADIRVPGQEDFREMALVQQDGMDLRLTSGRQVPDKKLLEIGPEGPVEEIEPDGGDVHAGGHSDAGEKGVNYTNAPLHRRLGAAPGALAKATSAAWAGVFSSATHGDPATPVARSYVGDQVRYRVLGANRARQTGFQLTGASWRQEPYDAQSPVVGVQGGIGTGKAVNAHVRMTSAGDQVWSSPTSYSLPDGMWGLARTYPRPADAAGFTPTPRATPDSPFAASSRPLQPLERSSAVVTLFADTDADGVRDEGEAAVAGAQVRLLATAGAPVLTTTSTATGTAALSPPRGSYDIEVVPPAGTTVVGGAKRRVDLTADAARVELAVGLAPLAGLRAVVFDDLDADGVRDPGEPGVPGWSVTVTGGAQVAPVVSGADGSATFVGVPAGTVAVGVQPRAGFRATTALPVSVTLGPTGADVPLGVTRAAGLTARPVDDADGDGVRGDGERVLAGLVVELTPEGGTPLRVRTGAEGATVDPAGRPARVRVLLPGTGLPWPCGTAVATTPAGPVSTPCGPDGVVQVPAGASDLVLLGAFPDGVVTTSLFDDADRDGRRDDGEAPLVDWEIALVRAADGVEVTRTTTDETGTAGLLAAPGAYRVVPLPPVAPVGWVATQGSYEVTVARGREATATGGWVQPGAVSVGVFHDLDKDGVREAGDDPLADRTVRLLSSTGAALASQVTDGTGRAAFPAKAGTSYRVSVDVPTGWQATSPRSGAAVLAVVPVTAPADGAQATVEVGHYSTVDRTAPAAPVASPGSSALSSATPVALTAETGAAIRFTLDGSLPTATHGMLYDSPVRVSMDRVLRAVAIDAVGNVSLDLAAAYDLPWSGKVGRHTPSAWAVTTGGAARGGAAETAADDGRTLAVASAPVGTRPTVDVTATVVLPADLRAAVALNVSASVRSTLRATRLRVQWWDPSTSTWRALASVTQGLDEAKLDVDLGPAARSVAADGSVKVRFVADVGQPFDLVVDHVQVTAVNRR